MNDLSMGSALRNDVMMSENDHGSLSSTEADEDVRRSNGSICDDAHKFDGDDEDFTDDESCSSDSEASYASLSLDGSSLIGTLTKEEALPWTLPPSSEDLLLPNEHLFGALEVYELCRHFSQSLQLSPFPFENLCAALMCRNQSSLLDNIHLALIRAIFRDEDTSDTLLVPQDSTGNFGQTLFILDRNTYGEVLRRYLESDQRFPVNVIRILEKGSYPFVEISERLTVLLWLSERVLQTQIIRDKVNCEGVSKNDDHCRDCGKCGDLLCCTSCSAVYHLRCLPEEMKIDSPSTWRCSICLKHELPGVTDCLFPWESAGTYVQAEPWGYDSHGRRYWFIARRLFVEDDDSGVISYYSTLDQFFELVKCFRGGTAEEDLCYQFLEFFKVIEYQLILNEVITRRAKDNGTSWFELNVGGMARDVKCTNGQVAGKKGKFCRKLLEAIERSLETKQQRIEEQCAEENNNKNPVEDSEFATMPSLSLVDSGLNMETDFYCNLGSAFKLGMEGTFMSYTNHYLEDPYAKSPYQRAEEHRKYKYISEKFHVDEEGLFKWPYGFSRSEGSILLMLRQSLHDLCLRFPETLMHPLWWKEQRADWLRTLDTAERLETLVNHLARFELLVRSSTLVELWCQGLGYSRLWRQTAMDREERSNQKAKAKEQQFLDEPNENAVFTKYTMLNGPPKHQIWKLKNEQYRVSGDGRFGGWIWIRRQPHVKPSLSLPHPFKSKIVQHSPHSAAINQLIMDFDTGFRCPSKREQVELPVQAPEHMECMASDQLPVEFNISLEHEVIRPVESAVFLNLAIHSPLIDVSEDSLLNTLESKREVAPVVAPQCSLCDSRASCYVISCRVFGRYACYSPSCIGNFSGNRFRLLGFGGRKRVEVDQPQGNVSSLFPQEPVHLMYKCCENEETNILNVSQSTLARLARRGPDDELDGFNCSAKAGWNWPYPSPRPTVQSCWRLATQRTPSLHSVAFLFRSLYMSIRWKDVLIKMPLQTKHVLKSESYNESREIIQHKDLPPFGLCCTYMTRYHRLADDLRSANFLSSSELDEDDFVSPEYAPSSSSLRRSSPSYSPWQLRKRKPKETQQADGVSDRFVWHDESIFLFWEVKNYWALKKRNYFMEKEREANETSNTFSPSRRSVLTKSTIVLSANKSSVSGSPVGLKTISVTPPNLRIASAKADGGVASSGSVCLRFPKTTTVSNINGPPILTSVSPVKLVPSVSQKRHGSNGTSALPAVHQASKSPLVMLRLADGRTVLSRTTPGASKEAVVGRATAAAPTSTLSPKLPARLSSCTTGNHILHLPTVNAEEFGTTTSSKLDIGRSFMDNNCIAICRSVLLQIVNKVVENERRQKLARRHKVNSESRRVYWKKYRLRAKAKQMQCDAVHGCMRQWRAAQRLRRETLKASVDSRVVQFFSKLRISKRPVAPVPHKKVGKLLAPVVFKKQRVDANRAPRLSSEALRIPFPLQRLPGKRSIQAVGKRIESADVSNRDDLASSHLDSSWQESVSCSPKRRSSLEKSSKERSSSDVLLGYKGGTDESISKSDFSCAYCSCPYNSERFYVACSLCSRWFHGTCAGITEAESKQMFSWHCKDCDKERERTVQELHCVCRTPYDMSRAYVCCDLCDGWFHCECVGLTAETAEAIPSYVCNICEEKRDVNAMVKKLTMEDYDKLEKLVVDLLNHKMSWPFRGTSSGNPLPSYNNFPSEIPDLNSILHGVLQRAYCTLADFAVDMAKIFNEAVFTKKLRSIKATLL
uniref:PHD-type domain-containing protein n=1 Tax=Trichuris muris TaxID=70415 RepID=A0A5S6QJZ2_TRIMR